VDPALDYSWSHDREFAVTEFGRNKVSERSAAEQRRTGEKIAVLFAAWLPPLGITAAIVPAIEADLALLDAFERHFVAHPSLLGATPTLADCARSGSFHAHLAGSKLRHRDAAARPPGRGLAGADAVRGGVVVDISAGYVGSNTAAGVATAKP
jgi:glutathione S-transferase